jgi:hypothetical protein
MYVVNLPATPGTMVNAGLRGDTQRRISSGRSDSGVRLEVLKVDGGVTANSLCMQLQENQTHCPERTVEAPVRKPASQPPGPIVAFGTGRGYRLTFSHGS